MSAILLITSKPEVQTRFRDALKETRHHLYTARRGTEAMNLLQERPVDLILLDPHLPDIDTDNLLNLLHGRYPYLVVVTLPEAYQMQRDDIVKQVNEALERLQMQTPHARVPK